MKDRNTARNTQSPRPQERSASPFNSTATRSMGSPNDETTVHDRTMVEPLADLTSVIASPSPLPQRQQDESANLVAPLQAVLQHNNAQVSLTVSATQSENSQETDLGSNVQSCSSEQGTGNATPHRAGMPTALTNAEVARDQPSLCDLDPATQEHGPRGSHNFKVNYFQFQLQATNLPPFCGRNNEDIDKWIAMVDITLKLTQVPEHQVIRLLPLVFHEKALVWLCSLEDSELTGLESWDQWQAALRVAFYPVNYELTMRRNYQYRVHEANESLLQYFTEKRRLQRYITTLDDPALDHHAKVQGILQGLGSGIRVFVRQCMTEETTMQGLRRIFIDLEPLYNSHFRPQ